MTKPAHLGPAYAAQFADASVVQAYAHRPPWPAAALDLLARFAGPPPGRVLDLGCGPGDLSRALALRGYQVHGVDPSAQMLALAAALPGGADVHWHHERGEDHTPRGPLTLAFAAESLHWMNAAPIMRALDAALTDDAVLVLLDRAVDDVPWWDDLAPHVPAFSTNTDYAPYDLTEDLVAQGLFQPLGRCAYPNLPHVQAVADYIASWHSRNGFSRERMAPDRAAAFDALLTRLTAPYTRPDGRLDVPTTTRVVWGIPRAPRAAAG